MKINKYFFAFVAVIAISAGVLSSCDLFRNVYDIEIRFSHQSEVYTDPDDPDDNLWFWVSGMDEADAWELEAGETMTGRFAHRAILSRPADFTIHVKNSSGVEIATDTYEISQGSTLRIIYFESMGGIYVIEPDQDD